jgi:hypothetical protein
MIKVEIGILVSNVMIVGCVRHAFQLFLPFQHFIKIFLFQRGCGIINVMQPSVPFGWDLGGVKVVDIARFDPTVLTKGIIDAIFVIAIASRITTHVSAKLEWEITILK